MNPPVFNENQDEEPTVTDSGMSRRNFLRLGARTTVAIALAAAAGGAVPASANTSIQTLSPQSEPAHEENNSEGDPFSFDPNETLNKLHEKGITEIDDAAISMINLYNDFGVLGSSGDAFASALGSEMIMPSKTDNFNNWGTNEGDLQEVARGKSMYMQDIEFSVGIEPDLGLKIGSSLSAIRRFTPHLIVSMKKIIFENDKGTNANGERIHYNDQDLMYVIVSSLHEGQHQFDFNCMDSDVKKYVNLKRSGNYEAVKYRSINQTLKDFAATPIEEVMFVKGDPKHELFAPGLLSGSGSNEAVDKLLKYFPNNLSQSYIKAALDKNPSADQNVVKLNGLIHTLVGELANKKSPIRNNLLGDPLVQSLIQGCVNELHHYFVGPVQDMGIGDGHALGVPTKKTPIGQILLDDILSQPNYDIELARLSVSNPNNPRKAQAEMWENVQGMLKIYAP